MAQKLLDLTDINKDSQDIKLPFRDKDGNDATRTLTVFDPKTSIILLFEQLREENEAVTKKAEEEGKDEKLTIKETRDYLEKMAFVLFQTDNEVTMEEIKSLPFSVLVSVSAWLKEYMRTIFLDVSPTNSTSDLSSSKKSKKGKESKKPTK